MQYAIFLLQPFGCVYSSITVLQCIFIIVNRIYWKTVIKLCLIFTQINHLIYVSYIP
jgi:hypothetical protein